MMSVARAKALEKLIREKPEQAALIGRPAHRVLRPSPGRPLSDDTSREWEATRQAPAQPREIITLETPATRLAKTVTRTEELRAAYEAAPSEAAYREYSEFYQRQYQPSYLAYGRWATEQRRKYVSEVGAAYPQLTKKELENIAANIGYIQRQPFAEQAPLARDYMKQWGRVAGARLEQDIRAIAEGEIADPWSLKFMKAAEAFPKQYRWLPGPSEDIIAGMAKAGSILVGSVEEVFGFFKGLGEPTTKTIKKPEWEVTIPKQRPPVSLITVFTMPEYRKWSPYAFIAAPIMIPLEFKAFGLGTKVAGKAAKTIIQTAFKGAYRFAPTVIKAEAMRHATISRYLGIGEGRLRVVSGATKLRAGSYEAMLKGTTRIETAYFGEVIKPAPRWLMPKFYEKLMPSRIRAAFMKYQHIRGAARPTWISKAAYEAMPKRFLELRVMPVQAQAAQATLRGFEIGKKQATWGVGVKRVERVLLGGRQALRPETLAKFKPSVFPEMIYFPATYPMVTPLAGAAVTVGHVLSGWQAMAAPAPPKPPVRMRTPVSFPIFKGVPRYREIEGFKAETATATMARMAQQQRQAAMVTPLAAPRTPRAFLTPFPFAERGRRPTRPRIPFRDPFGLYRHRRFPMELFPMRAGRKRRRKK